MAEHRTRAAVGTTERGQSVFDFSLGVGVFIVAVAAAMVFIPTAFAGFNPETTGGEDTALKAERAVEYLSESTLSRPDNGGLDTSCTFLFFTGSTGHPDVDSSPSECGLDPGGTVASNASLASHLVTVNVTIEEDVSSSPGLERLYWNESENTLKKLEDWGGSTNDFNLTAGSSAETNENYVTARRYTRLNGRGVYIVVRVW